MDLVMVYEHILGLRELNSYQKIAADVLIQVIFQPLIL